MRNVVNLNRRTVLGIVSISVFSVSHGCSEKIPDELPNILWLVSEDNSPMLGCYGDDFANTPHLDRLASEGFIYTHAYANAPVCAPARNTIISGVYANSNGHQHMRSYYRMSDAITTYPELMRERGYYCTNNAKTDYNTSSIKPNVIWDESSNEAHYKNRAEGQPFFAVFNTNLSHEHKLHTRMPQEVFGFDIQDVPIPPYHPETYDMRYDWAQFYHRITMMDDWMGEKLRELDELGLAENTIVFYYSDHGGALARSKRYVYETGTHVPFIVRIPEKYKYLFPAKKPGAAIERLISFVDLAPTLMSIAGIPIPDFMQGNAFLGTQKSADPDYVYMFRGRMDERYDMSRSVRDSQYRYIRNYMPYRIYGQYIQYLWRAPSVRSWERAFMEGKCNELQSVFWNPKPAEELYDTENDPWEVNNLANDPAYKDVLVRMRKANIAWVSSIHDAGFIPEAELVERAGDQPIYDFMRSGVVNLPEIIEAAEVATFGGAENLDLFRSFLKHEEAAIRYWGATGMLMLGKGAAVATDDLVAALNDSSPNVVAVAAEALYLVGETDVAINALAGLLRHPAWSARCHALNVIDTIEDYSQVLLHEIQNLLSSDMTSRYDIDAARRIVEKWEAGNGEQ